MSHPLKRPHCPTCAPANQDAEVRRLANGTLDASTLRRHAEELAEEAKATKDAGERGHLETRARYCALAEEALSGRERAFAAKRRAEPTATLEELRARRPLPPPLSPGEEVRSILQGFLNLVPLLLIPEPKQSTVSSVSDLLARARESLAPVQAAGPEVMREPYSTWGERLAERGYHFDGTVRDAGTTPQETVLAFAERARKALLEKRDSLDDNTNAGQRGRRGGLEEAASIIHTLANTTP